MISCLAARKRPGDPNGGAKMSQAYSRESDQGTGTAILIGIVIFGLFALVGYALYMYFQVLGSMTGI